MLSRQHTHRIRNRLILVSLLLAIFIGSFIWGIVSLGPDQPGKTLPGVSSTPTGSNFPIPLSLGLDAYRHLDKLSYLEIGDRVAGQSTADPGGSNVDKSHYLRILPNGEHVLFDQVGPGMVTFMRMQENYGGPWNLSLDGHVVTTIGTTDLGQMQPSGDPAQAFPYPLSLNMQESQGSSILATTIPFQQSMLWTSQHPNGNFYALYRKLPYGTALPAWQSTSSPNDVVQLLRRAGTDIAAGSNALSEQSGNVALASGVNTPITTLTGPSQIRALTFHVPFSEMVRFGNARLLIYWDGEARPSVDAPLKFLAGDGAGVYQPSGRPLVQGWIAGAGGDGSTFMDFNLYWPMPFHTSARIFMLSDASLSAINWRVRYEPFPDPSGWWAPFHATYSSVPSPTPGQDMTFLDVTGSGKLVGTVINFTAPDGTLEGDPHIYLDDSQTPQIAVTGTEEWGLGGNYWNGGKQVTLPLGGLPSSSDNPAGTDHDGAALYRFLIADSVPFNRHLVVRWEHGGANESTHPYRAVVLWYGTPVQTALPSDEVLPASADSRLLHGYQSSGEQTYDLNAAYEYLVHSPLSVAVGSNLSGMASFKMALDPHNVGAFLRRTFDYCIPNQRANIYLDNHFAGTWYSAGASTSNAVDGHQRCWREEEFPLPAALTMGKVSVMVRVEFVPTTDPQDSTWTAFRYEMYSFVLPQSNKTGQASTILFRNFRPMSQYSNPWIAWVVTILARRRTSTYF